VNQEFKGHIFPKEKLENLRIVEAAANYIQKIYRGYRTRMFLRDHLRKLLVEEMMQNGEDENQLIEMGLQKYV
jgi:hypothetical protein